MTPTLPPRLSQRTDITSVPDCPANRLIKPQTICPQKSGGFLRVPKYDWNTEMVNCRSLANDFVYFSVWVVVWLMFCAPAIVAHRPEAPGRPP